MNRPIEKLAMIFFTCLTTFFFASVFYARAGADNPRMTASQSSSIKKIEFSTEDLVVSDKGNGWWAIVDTKNKNRVIVLQNKREYAETALKVMKYYGISEKYVIKRSDIFIAPGNPPETTYPGERSTPFDPEKVTLEKKTRLTKTEVADASSYWALMDGKKQIADLGDDETAARRIFQMIIQEKRLNRICGAGGVISYWRKGLPDTTAQNQKMKENKTVAKDSKKQLATKDPNKTESQKGFDRTGGFDL